MKAMNLEGEGQEGGRVLYPPPTGILIGYSEASFRASGPDLRIYHVILIFYLQNAEYENNMGNSWLWYSQSISLANGVCL